MGPPPNDHQHSSQLQTAWDWLILNNFMRPSLIFIIWSLSKGRIHLTGKFKPVIKKAMVELDGNISEGTLLLYAIFLIHKYNLEVSFFYSASQKAKHHTKNSMILWSGEPFKKFASLRDEWAVENCYISPGQYSASNINLSYQYLIYFIHILLVIDYRKKNTIFLLLSAKLNLQIFTCSFWFWSPCRSNSICWSCIECD